MYPHPPYIIFSSFYDPFWVIHNHYDHSLQLHHNYWQCLVALVFDDLPSLPREMISLLVPPLGAGRTKLITHACALAKPRPC